MKVTIWIDWDNEIICSSKKELVEDFEDSDSYPEFDVWLNNHYMADEIWDADTDAKTAIKQEYHKYYDTCLTDFINEHYETIEIEV